METQTSLPTEYQQPGHQPEQETALRALPRVLRRRALVVLVPLVAVPAVAVLLAAHQPKEYTASTTLVYRDAPAFASQNPDREAATNFGLLQTGVIADRARAKLGRNASSGTIKVIGTGTSNLITVQATARNPRGAAKLANGVAREFIRFRLNAAQSSIASEQRRLTKQLADIKGSTKDAIDQRAALQGRLGQLSLTNATLTPDVRQISKASVPTSPSAPHPLRSGVVGGVVGLVIGLLIALTLERLDLRVRDPRQFEDAFARPILGRIPRSRALSKRSAAIELPPVEGQAFADLRAKVRHHVGSPNGNAKSLVITSAEAAEGKTTVTWHLACAAAGTGQRVLVVEADLRRPGLSAKLGTDGKPGLSEVLRRRAPLSQAIRQIPVGSRSNGNASRNPHTVDVIFAGSPTGDPTALLESVEMRSLLDHVANRYDLVIIDTPPTSVANDAVPLVTRASGVIVVGRLARSRVGAVADLSKQLREVEAPTLGVVVNSIDVPRDVYRYYYGRSGV